MNSRKSSLMTTLFRVKEKHWQITQLDLMINEFNRMTHELETQIRSEEKRTCNRDPNHYAYSSVAQAARQRQNNLFVSINDLMTQKKRAEASLTEAKEELAKAEARDDRERKTCLSTPKELRALSW